MNIVQKAIYNVLAKAANFPRAVPWALWSQPSGTRVNYGRQLDPLESSLVMATVNWIARTFPEAPPIISAKANDGALTRSPKHPMVELLRRPNPHYSGSVLWMATLLSWTVDGNAYWIKERNALGGGVVELWYTPHWLIDPKWSMNDNTTFITHYEYRPGSVPIKMPVEDVVHMRYGLDPANIRKGLSPLKSLLREIWTDQEAAVFTATLLRNAGVPGLVISPKGDMVVAPSPDEVLETRAYFQERTTGDHRGEPMVMKGPTEVDQFGFNPEQMNLRSIRQIPEERVTAVLGVPAAVVGLGTGLEQTKVGATMRELRELAYENNIVPTQRLFAEELATQLLPEFEPDPTAWEFGFDLSGVRVLQEDENSRAERWVKLVAGGLATRAEGREAEGLPILATDNVYLQPLAVIEVPVGQPAPVPGGGGSSSDDSDDDDDKGLGQWPELKATRAQSRLIQQFRRDHARLEAVFASDLTKLFDDLGDRALRAARDHVKDATPVSSSTNGHVDTKAEPSDDDIRTARLIIGSMGLEAWKADRLRPAFEGHYIRASELTVDTINTVMNLGVDIPDPAARRIVATGGKRMGLVDVTEDTRRAIFRALAEGRALGDGPPALARRIRDHVPAGRFANAGPQYRANLIARTETKFAQNVSSMEVYRAADVITGVLAFDDQLGDGDDECSARNGQVFTFDQADAETDKEHPNGTLSWAPNIG